MTRRITQDTRETSLELVKDALIAETRDHRSMSTRAENFVAIAETFGVPIEHLLLWIHHPAIGKQWTAAEFRRFAERYAEERERAKAQP